MSCDKILHQGYMGFTDGDQQGKVTASEYVLRLQNEDE